MHINRVFELSITLDSDKFEDVFSRCYCDDDFFDRDSEKFVDRSLADKGIIVCYQSKQYKKKIIFTVDAATLTSASLSNTEKLINKLEKRITKYFYSEFTLEDFTLSALNLSTSIDVGSRDKAADYLRVIRRIGKVKGFSPKGYDWLEENSSFCLRGNSNGINFMFYDLEHIVAHQLKNEETDHKTIDKYTGVLQTQVHLTKPKAIRRYTCAYGTAEQITELSEKCPAILMENFSRIIPYGDFYKKDEAEQIIRSKVTDVVLKRRMLRLLTLIPEKKSLLLAQKSMSYRHPNELLVEFAKINLSPITISKRHNVKHLENLYTYLDF